MWTPAADLNTTTIRASASKHSPPPQSYSFAFRLYTHLLDLRFGSAYDRISNHHAATQTDSRHSSALAYKLPLVFPRPIMSNYVDTGSQTEWAGLMQRKIVRPETLFSPAPFPATSTPPDEPLTIKEQCTADHPVISPGAPQVRPHTPPQSNGALQKEVPTMSTSPLLARRQNVPAFTYHLDLPPPLPQVVEPRTLDDEVPVSPPPTAQPLSPLPEANRRFAGHTPLYAGSPSQEMLRRPPPNRQLHPTVPESLKSLPAHEMIVEQDPSEDADTEPQLEDESQSATPQGDIGLTGPLTLAPNPSEGTQNNILLSALDQELDKIAQQQAQADGAAENDQPPSRKGSADSRTSEAQYVDGVILKKTVPMNFGAPLGEV
ncbi:hypothetical protein OPT61_g8676 [Boeremia exigua]|uniref:Uncharacterized protein n=1 Tax=Boeremia exigua TaxID=749465 RepID=A0ACC2HXA1_9PLEO|nr:hypothetical protein OPT61_g8676 [Boeremia exigua]